MSGIHSPLSRHFFTVDGMVKKSGGAKGLAQGQFALVQANKPTADGAAVIGDNMSALSANAVLEMRLGKFQVQGASTTNGYDNKPYSSENFKLGSIVNVKTMTPKVIEQAFDSWIVGYDGINDNSALVIPEGRASVLDIHFSGDVLNYAVGAKTHLAKFHLYREVGEVMQEVIARLYKDIINYTFSGGVKLTDLAQIKLVDSKAVAATGTEFVYSTLVVSNEGESSDLAMIQGQYAYDVKQTGRQGLDTTYTMLRPLAQAPAAYVIYEGGFVKGCASCPTGYTALTGGFVYSVALEDNGVDQKALVQALPNAVASSAVKKGQDGGKGTYLVALAAKLTQANINAFLASGTVQDTAEIDYVAETQDVCKTSTTNTIAWVTGDSCFASTEAYRLQLKEGDCTESRLTDLRSFYNDNAITEVEGTTASGTITLTGTSGTANIAIAAVNYLATFETNLAVTALKFVNLHKSDVFAVTGGVLTSNGATITFTHPTVGFPTRAITNVTTNLAGTVGTVTINAEDGGCQRVYEKTVVTNIVCADCDPIFTELFVSEAPKPFEFSEWKKLNTSVANGASLMGIKIIGKPIISRPTDLTRDMIPYMESSVRIMIAGGYLEDINSVTVDYREYPLLLTGEPFKIKLLSRAVDRDNLGWHLLPWEDVSRTYFSGVSRHKDNIYARTVLGEESVLKFDAQYVGFEITIMDRKFSQGAGHTSNIGTSYTVWAEIGRHQALESLVQAMAAKVGLPVEVALAY